MNPDAIDLLTVLLWGGLGLLGGFIVSLALTMLLRLFVKRSARRFIIRRIRTPQRIFFMLLGAGLAVSFVIRPRAFRAAPEWQPAFVQAFLIVMIFATALLLTGIIRAVGETLTTREGDAEETPHFRRVRTQMQIVTRVGLAVIWICALAGALLTFHEFRAIGASLMASAGVLSIVAGLAAQSSLANIFAGMQIAFSDALRVGDLVVFDEQMGSVEEITLTYVVVRAWDDRRWIVPSTHFTGKPFQNWTRREPKLLGTVEFDLDWLAPVEAMRVELTRIVRSSELWDGRTASMQVTEATGGHVRIRAVVSAATSGQLWDLRCLVREELIGWVQHQAVYALPRTRLEPETTAAPPAEEREDFVDRIVTEWEAEQAVEKTSVLPPVKDRFEDTGEDEALPKWLNSWLSHRRKPVVNIRDEEESPVETTLSARSPEARLYSGSPEAEERDRKMSGPSAADMAEREQNAERRHTAATDDPTDDPATSA